MHPEFLQIRHQAIAAILANTHKIDTSTDLAAQHRTRTYNAIVIAGALTGILGNVDCDLAQQFADALGLDVEQTLSPSSGHKPLASAQAPSNIDLLESALAQKKQWRDILLKLLNEEPRPNQLGVDCRALQRAHLELLTLEIEHLQAALPQAVDTTLVVQTNQVPA